jgi:hypothetical protein
VLLGVGGVRVAAIVDGEPFKASTKRTWLGASGVGHGARTGGEEKDVVFLTGQRWMGHAHYAALGEGTWVLHRMEVQGSWQEAGARMGQGQGQGHGWGQDVV